MIVVASELDAGNALPKDQKPIEGIWQGTLKVGSTDLRLVLKIGKDADGQTKASFDSPDQGVKGIPVTSVSRDGDSITVESKSIKGVFDGQLNEDGSAMKGHWKQGGASFAIEF